MGMRTNDELVAAILEGDQSGFAELVRRYERAAWVTAWKILRDFHDAQDATQNAFVEAYRRLGQLRTPACFGLWLLRIARREALRLARRRGRREVLTSASELALSSTTFGSTREFDELLQAIGRLPEQERLVVVLRFLDGHPVAEVARLTGRPVGTVTKQSCRALERLRSLLRDMNHDSR